jgi:hypothetical protein
MQKFDEIFNEINNKFSYVDDIWEKIILGTASLMGSKVMSIIKNWEVTYRLTNENWKFELSYWQNLEKSLNNLSIDELLNKILPNFKRRLNEWKRILSQQRKKAIKDANQYAYQQDQQSAYNLLQENWLA